MIKSETLNAESDEAFDGGFYDPESPVSMTRCHVPHWHQDGVSAFVTWRLVDSLPAGFHRLIREERKDWLRGHPLPWGNDDAREYNRLFTNRIEAQLDAGVGRCILRSTIGSEIVGDALLHFDRARYRRLRLL